MRPMPLSPLPNFSQKAPYWGWECPQRWGSWKATYRKKGLRGAGPQCQGLVCDPGEPLLQEGAPRLRLLPSLRVSCEPHGLSFPRALFL